MPNVSTDVSLALAFRGRANSSVFDALDFDIYTVTNLASITGTGGLTHRLLRREASGGYATTYETR